MRIVFKLFLSKENLLFTSAANKSSAETNIFEHFINLIK